MSDRSDDWFRDPAPRPSGRGVRDIREPASQPRACSAGGTGVPSGNPPASSPAGPATAAPAAGPSSRRSTAGARRSTRAAASRDRAAGPRGLAAAAGARAGGARRPGPPVAAPAPDPGHHRPGRRGRPGAQRGRVLLPELQADPGQRARRLPEPAGRLGRAELAHHRVGQPPGTEPEAGAPAGHRGGHRRPPLGHGHAAAHPVQRAGRAGQPAPRLVREHPRVRHEQAERRLRLRRPQAAGQDRAERHRPAGRPLHGDRLRRPGQRGGRGRRGAHVHPPEPRRPGVRAAPEEGVPEPDAARRRWASSGPGTCSPPRTCSGSRTSGCSSRRC